MPVDMVGWHYILYAVNISTPFKIWCVWKNNISCDVKVSLQCHMILPKSF